MNRLQVFSLHLREHEPNSTITNFLIFKKSNIICLIMTDILLASILTKIYMVRTRLSSKASTLSSTHQVQSEK